MEEGWKNYCHSCSVAGPWVELPAGPPCHCDDTWFRRACLWSRSKKGWWFCSRCFDASADQAQALGNLCVHCKFKVSEVLRIQTQRNQSDAMINFRSIHMQQFSTRITDNKFTRATGNYVGKARPAEKPNQELKMVNGKWTLIQKGGVEADARALRDQMGIKPKSQKSRSRSRSRARSRAKRKKRKKSSSSSSSSRSSSSSGSPVAVVSGSNIAGESKASGDKEDSSEIAKVKSEVLNKILKLKEIESKEQRQKEFRSLLRAWHPDKNPDKVEVATEIFQFLQKGKKLLD